MNLDALREKAGVVYMTGFQPEPLTNAVKQQLAMDAQSVAVTAPNSGVPSLFTTYVDPRVIEVLVTPMKMATAFGERKMGDWTSQSLMFPVVESDGQVATYGDWNENGMNDANVNYPERQPYHYQGIIRLGEREQAIYDAAKLNWAYEKQKSVALALNKFQNKSYIFGVSGLKNYGILNDPNLLAAATDTNWVAKDGQGVYDSISQKLYSLLITQTKGLVDRDTPMTLLMSPELEVNLTKTNQYNVNVSDQLKKNFPNLKVVTIPEFATAAGQEVKLIVEEYEGTPTLELSFTEKMRVHRLIPAKSGWEQKRSQGTSGCIIYRPIFIASMLVANP